MAGDLASNRNEILTLINEAWKSVPDYFAGFPEQADMLVTMTDGDGVPEKPGRKAWIRVSIQHTASRDRSISRRRVVNSGLLTVQCFIFRGPSSDDDRVQRLADYIVGIIKRHNGSVLFTETVAQERSINNNFAQCDVTSRFQWDEFIKPGPYVPNTGQDYFILSEEDMTFLLTEDGAEIAF